jgi:hypothetical protein
MFTNVIIEYDSSCEPKQRVVLIPTLFFSDFISGEILENLEIRLGKKFRGLSYTFGEFVNECVMTAGGTMQWKQHCREAVSCVPASFKIYVNEPSFIPINYTRRTSLLTHNSYLFSFPKHFYMDLSEFQSVIMAHRDQFVRKQLLLGKFIKNILPRLGFTRIELAVVLSHFRGFDDNYLVCVEDNPGPTPQTQSVTQSLSDSGPTSTGSGQDSSRKGKSDHAPSKKANYGGNSGGMAKLFEAVHDMEAKMKGTDDALKSIQLDVQKKKDKTAMRMLSEGDEQLLHICDVTEKMRSFNWRRRTSLFVNEATRKCSLMLDQLLIMMQSKNTPKRARTPIKELIELFHDSLPSMVERFSDLELLDRSIQDNIYCEGSDDLHRFMCLAGLFIFMDPNLIAPILTPHGELFKRMLKNWLCEVGKNILTILAIYARRWFKTAPHLKTFKKLMCDVLEFLNPFEWYAVYKLDQEHLESVLCLEAFGWHKQDNEEIIDSRPYDLTHEEAPKEVMLTGQYVVKNTYRDLQGQIKETMEYDAIDTNLSFLGLYKNTPVPQKLKNITLSQIMLSNAITWRNNRTLPPADQSARLRASYNTCGANTYLSQILIEGDDIFYDQYELIYMYLANKAEPVVTAPVLVK